jgi:hypothetical protein
LGCDADAKDRCIQCVARERREIAEMGESEIARRKGAELVLLRTQGQVLIAGPVVERGHTGPRIEGFHVPVHFEYSVRGSEGYGNLKVRYECGYEK